MSDIGNVPAALNAELRLQIVDLVRRAEEGHIPSSFSIVDIIAEIYDGFLRLRKEEPLWKDRDRFVLSKGHGAAALFVVLARQGLIDPDLLNTYGTPMGVLGGHPDSVTTDFIESSTGSLGHGFPGAVGMALGLKLLGSPGRVVVLVGDGECHEGTVWEAANVAANRNLSNLVVFIDWNLSAAQLMPIDHMPEKWAAFGWETIEIDGHDPVAIRGALSHFELRDSERPLAVVARTVKGKGARLVEGHGPWHHKIPNEEEYSVLRRDLGVGSQ